ncbi:ThiF family adenylyltransferase [Nonomuraea sp. NPDC050680]|uniref:ThiF family adenylyltransferase n=1 Tax=Nonomuraea sp. NPDC050680 TaxID=3154630 RepID=UPI0033F0D698
MGITQLQPYWPVTDLASVTAMVVGVGSIGGAAATALAGYGLGRLLLVDPDRLLWHNLVRHVLPRRYIGKFKVDALRDYQALTPCGKTAGHGRAYSCRYAAILPRLSPQEASQSSSLGLQGRQDRNGDTRPLSCHRR